MIPFNLRVLSALLPALKVRSDLRPDDRIDDRNLAELYESLKRLHILQRNADHVRTLTFSETPLFLTQECADSHAYA
jgi:hypothetical protein